MPILCWFSVKAEGISRYWPIVVDSQAWATTRKTSKDQGKDGAMLSHARHSPLKVPNAASPYVLCSHATLGFSAR